MEAFVMLKQIVKAGMRRFGFDVVRYSPPPKSTRTRALTYYETASGNYFLPTDAHADLVANTIKGGWVFDPEIVDLAKRYIREGTIVLDIGANFGQMSVLFSRMVGDSGKVYSFEADDFIFEILEKNIAANQRTGKIVPVFGAVYHTAGETLFFPVQNFQRFPTYGSYGIDYNGGPGRPVKTVTIDSLKIEDPISFMKVDIQGGDLQGLQGSIETIKKHRMPIVFEYEYTFEDEFKMSFQDYVDFVQSINYRFEKVVNGHNFLVVPR
jgi:FkbM family methyltransferase